MKPLKIQKVPVRLVLGIILFALLVLVVAVLAHEVVGEQEDWFDSHAFTYLKGHSTSASIQLFRQITFLGSTYFLFPAYLVLLVWLWFKGRRQDAIDVGLLGVVSTIMLFTLKAFFARPRPSDPLFAELTNYSFPSGHALSSFVFCSALGYLVWKSGLPRGIKILLMVLLWVLAVIIGISRIVLRYHYASDVVAGFCIGCAWVLLYFWLQPKVFRKRNEKQKMMAIPGGLPKEENSSTSA